MQGNVSTIKHDGHKDHQTNTYWCHLPETFSIRDEQIGVWWVTMAARYFYRARTVPGTWKEKHQVLNLVQRKH